MTFVFVNLFFISTFSTLLKGYFLDRKVDELDKTIAVAARDPALYGIDETELERRRRWTSNARTQVLLVQVYSIKMIHNIEIE